MKPQFALDLTHTGVRLLHLAGAEETELGSVALDDPAFEQRVYDLYQLAEARAKGRVRTLLVIPNSEVLYTRVPTGTGDRDARATAVAEALEGMTPYALDELVYDWRADGDEAVVSAVARLTLDEAEAFATERGFNPLAFSARPVNGAFKGIPNFGPTKLAEARKTGAPWPDRPAAPAPAPEEPPTAETAPEPATPDVSEATEAKAPEVQSDAPSPADDTPSAIVPDDGALPETPASEDTASLDGDKPDAVDEQVAAPPAAAPAEGDDSAPLTEPAPETPPVSTAAEVADTIASAMDDWPFVDTSAPAEPEPAPAEPEPAAEDVAAPEPAAPPEPPKAQESEPEEAPFVAVGFDDVEDVPAPERPAPKADTPPDAAKDDLDAAAALKPLAAADQAADSPPPPKDKAPATKKRGAGRAAPAKGRKKQKADAGPTPPEKAKDKPAEKPKDAAPSFSSRRKAPVMDSDLPAPPPRPAGLPPLAAPPKPKAPATTSLPPARPEIPAHLARSVPAPGLRQAPKAPAAAPAKGPKNSRLSQLMARLQSEPDGGAPAPSSKPADGPIGSKPPERSAATRAEAGSDALPPIHDLPMPKPPAPAGKAKTAGALPDPGIASSSLMPPKKGETAVLPPPKKLSRGGLDEAQAMTLFGAREERRERSMTPVLVGIAVALVVAIAVWASVFLLGRTDDAPTANDSGAIGRVDPSVETAAPAPGPLQSEPQPGEVEVAALPPETVAPPVEEPAPIAVEPAPEPAPEPEPEPEPEPVVEATPPSDTPPALPQSETATLTAPADVAAAPTLGEADASPVASAAPAAPAASAVPDTLVGPQQSAQPLPNPANRQEAESRYAALGIWQIPPEPPTLPEAGRIDDLRLASLAGTTEFAAAPRISEAPEVASLTPPAAPVPPAPPGTEFDLSDDGLVVATPDGALSPQGVRVTAGAPAATPPTRPARPGSLRDIVPINPSGVPDLRPLERPTGQAAAQEDTGLRPASVAPPVPEPVTATPGGVAIALDTVTDAAADPEANDTAPVVSQAGLGSALGLRRSDLAEIVPEAQEAALPAEPASDLAVAEPPADTSATVTPEATGATADTIVAALPTPQAIQPEGADAAAETTVEAPSEADLVIAARPASDDTARPVARPGATTAEAEPAPAPLDESELVIAARAATEDTARPLARPGSALATAAPAPQTIDESEVVIAARAATEDTARPLARPGAALSEAAQALDSADPMAEPPVAAEIATDDTARPLARPGSVVARAETERTAVQASTAGVLRVPSPPARPANFASLVTTPQLTPETTEPPTAPPDTPAEDVAAAGNAELPASPYAVISSMKPKNRPKSVERSAARVRQNTGPAVVASARVSPTAPSSARVAKTATEANVLNLARLNLIGVYGGNSDRRALVRLPSGRFVKVEVGDRLDGGRVAAIGDSQLRYTKGGQNITLKMPRG